MSKDNSDLQNSTGYQNEETLRRLYIDSRLSINDIADRYDVDYNTVYYWMDKHGVERRDKSSEVRRQNLTDSAHYYTTEKGRTYWRSWNGDGSDYVLVYRLLAVSEYGFDMVADKHVHHKNSIPWDNRPENIELLSPEEHGSIHGAES